MTNNLQNRYDNKLDFKLNLDDYWDLYLSDQLSLPVIRDNIISGDTLITYFDFNDPDIYTTGSTSANTIFSLEEWSDAVNGGVINSTIGFTGIDNGLVLFNKMSGDTGNTALLSALTGSNLTISSGETRFIMNNITGTTGNYVYPIFIDNEPDVGDYAKLCGGFYQGFYKLEGYDYQVLPTKYEEGWTAEFWLRKNDDNCSGNTANTLNDTYPDNKGMFFYMGTRAENKFWNVFEGLNDGPCSSSTATTYCTKVKETDIDIGKYRTLSPPKTIVRENKNQFLIYHRANEGFFHSDCDDPDEEDKIPGGLADDGRIDSITLTDTDKRIVDERNPFLVYHRANEGFFHSDCDDTGKENDASGGLAKDFSGFTKPITRLDKEADLVGNAIGFKINDDGSLGYKKATSECITSGNTNYTALTLTEATTEETDIIKDKEWAHVSIKFNPYKQDLKDCSHNYKENRKGKLSIYVNGKLKLVERDFTEVNTRALDNYYLKQVGVPHNMSVGGGTQGLLESQTFDGPDPNDKGLFLERNFGGTFIGDISKFRLYNRSLTWCEIQNNVKEEKDQYGLNIKIDCN